MFRKLLLTTTLALTTFGGVALAADDYKIDDDHTSVIFAVKHFDAAWVYGRFNDVSGQLSWDANKPGDIKFNVTIKTASVDTDNDKRDKHLRNADFFNAEEFPEITLVSKKVTKAGDKGYKVTADVTMHGVTKEMTIPFAYTGEGKDPWGGYRLGLHSEFELKRSDFGITHMPEGLSDKVKVIVAIEGTRKLIQ